MTKQEIERQLAAFATSSVFSAPDRGPWGDNRYRGNCTGWLIAAFIRTYGVKRLAELFAGGGTGSDVARDMGIQYIGADLNPNPKRSDIITLDAVADEVPDAFREADFIFAHPPYGAEIRIPYAGSMYADPDGSLSRKDLGQMPWDRFMDTLNKVILKYYSAMAPGARMGLLVGNIRRNGVYRSMLTALALPGEVVQTMVKIQHNCTSNGREYSSRNFFTTDHEDIVVIRKPGGFLISYTLPRRREVDIRDAAGSTWKDVVRTVLQSFGRPVSLFEIYNAVDGHAKTRTNPHWQEKIRQTLQTGRFSHDARGTWSLAPAA